MKKKIAALLTTLMVLTIGTTAFAATSPTTTTTSGGSSVAAVETKAPEAYVEAVKEVKGGTVSALTTAQVSAAATQAVNVVSSLPETLPETYSALKNADSTKTIVPNVLAAIEVTADPGATVTLSIEGISASDMVLVLHFNTTTGAWETIVPTVADGTVTFTSATFSPISIVKYTVESKESTDSNNDSTTTTTTTTTSDGTVESPKTGEAAPVVAVVAVICLAGVAVCGKKVKSIA
jgi:hypothetical protein